MHSTLNNSPHAIKQGAARFMILSIFAVVLLGGCGQPVSAPREETSTETREPPRSDAGQPHIYGGQYSPGHSDTRYAAKGNTPEGAQYAELVLNSDPNRKFVQDAFVRDESVLGVIVSPTMTRAQVQEAMASLTKGMAERFKNKELQVIMYYQSGDEMARTTYDGRTGNSTVKWKD